jgi:hypothetical protein
LFSSSAGKSLLLFPSHFSWGRPWHHSMMPPGGVSRIDQKLIHPSARKGVFCELRLYGVLGS